MSSDACVHSALPSSITFALDPTLSISQLVTIETFSPTLCSSAHTNNNLSLSSVTSHHNLYLYIIFYYFYFHNYTVFTLTFCINVSYRPIVNVICNTMLTVVLPIL